MSTEHKIFDDGGPAFPVEVQSMPDGSIRPLQTGHMIGWANGLTVRDYFAAHCPAMPEQWFKDSPRKKSDPLLHWGEAHATWSCFYADAMIAARKGGAA